LYIALALTKTLEYTPS